jgi:DNA-binding transcriptional ArsR family regulator
MTTLKTIFGYKRRPFKRDAQGKLPRFEVVVERPTYDLTVFKVHFGKLTVKIYSKGEHVLRIEVIVHNTRDLRCSRTIEHFPQVVAELKKILERFLSILQAVDVSFLDDPTWERWPLPSTVGRTRVGGIQVHHPRMRAVLEAVVALSPNPRGFTASDLAERIRHLSYGVTSDYTTRQASYDLKKLRGQGLVLVLPRSRRYQTPRDSLRAITAFFVLREKVLRPLLANAGRLPTGRPRHKRSPAEIHYINIQREMQELFEHLGIAA